MIISKGWYKGVFEFSPFLFFCTLPYFILVSPNFVIKKALFENDVCCSNHEQNGIA